MKVNVNRLIRGNDFIGIEYIIRDSLGTVLGAGVQRMSVRQGMKFTKEFGLTNIVMESDSNSVITRLL